MGEITGSVRDRDLRITAVSKSESQFSRIRVPGARVEVILRSEMRDLHFRAEHPGDYLPLLGTTEVEINDPELDPLLRLMKADAPRYRQLLLQPEVKKRVMRAFESNGVLIVRDGTLTMARPGQDPSQLGQLLDEALDLAETLEHGDGIGWRQAADAFDLSLTQQQGEWKLRSKDGSSQVEVGYRIGTQSSVRRQGACSEARIRLDDRLATLRIGRRDLERPGLRSGDPILDAHVHISGVWEDRIREWCAMEGFTEGVMNLVKGLKGSVEEGWIVSEQDGLMVEPGNVIADMLAVVEILETSLPESPESPGSV
jgi:hypothetical protein